MSKEEILNFLVDGLVRDTAIVDDRDLDRRSIHRGRDGVVRELRVPDAALLPAHLLEQGDRADARSFRERGQEGRLLSRAPEAPGATIAETPAARSLASSAPSAAAITTC